MGRGRTTTGMVTACLISTTTQWVHDLESSMLEVRADDDDEIDGRYDSIDGPSEEEAYLQGKSYLGVCRLLSVMCGLAGEYKTILQLVSVLSHGKMAKRLTDRAIDLMQDVQNIRKAIYEYVPDATLDILPLADHWSTSYKLKVNACEKGSSKQRKLMDIGINYLYAGASILLLHSHTETYPLGIDTER